MHGWLLDCCSPTRILALLALIIMPHCLQVFANDIAFVYHQHTHTHRHMDGQMDRWSDRQTHKCTCTISNQFTIYIDTNSFQYSVPQTQTQFTVFCTTDTVYCVLYNIILHHRHTQLLCTVHNQSIHVRAQPSTPDLAIDLVLYIAICI